MQREVFRAAVSGEAGRWENKQEVVKVFQRVVDHALFAADARLVSL